jgi:hypothetical protein
MYALQKKAKEIETELKTIRFNFSLDIVKL